MKKRKILMSLFSIFVLVSCGTKENSSKKDEANAKLKEEVQSSKNAKILKVLEEIKSEPKVKDAVITEADILYVQVLDDGTLRNGYADYLCQVLSDYNVTVNGIKVMKLGSQNDLNKDNAYGILLGESNCKF